MSRQLIIVLIFASLVSASQKQEWQHGIIVSVDKHSESQTSDSHQSSYDIALRVGDVIYVVIYTVPGSSSTVDYRVGTDLVVLVTEPTLTFNDLQGNPHTVEIIRKQKVNESKVP